MAKILIIILFLLPNFSIAEDSGKIEMKITPMAKWGYSIEKNLVRLGNKSERFEVRHGDCFQISSDWNDCKMDRERAELSSHDTKKFKPNSNIWLGWSIYIPEDFSMGYKMLTIAGQLHREGGPRVGSGKSLNMPPLFAFFIASNAAGLAIWDTKNGDKMLPSYIFSTKDVKRDMFNRWTDIVVNYNNEGGVGRIALFVNGKKLGTKEKVEIGKPDFYYFKYGIYRSHLSGHLKAKGSPLGTQVIYFDEVKSGNSFIDVSVNPRNPLN